MIPYDDLVNALTAWRARQGLPVATTAAPPPVVGRTAPPGPPPMTPMTPMTPADDFEAVDAAALVEEHYENEGDDFAMRFDHAQADAESTAIGGPPEPSRESFGGGATDPHRGPDRDDW